MKPYPLVNDLLRAVRRAAIPRAPRLYTPGATIHGVARCNNREFYFTSVEDFAVLLTHLREMRREKGTAHLIRLTLLILRRNDWRFLGYSGLL